MDVEGLWREASPRLFSGSARTCSDAVHSQPLAQLISSLDVGVQQENVDFCAGSCSFVLPSSTSFCNANCISFEPILFALAKRT